MEWGDEASSKSPLTLCSSKSFNNSVEYPFQQGYSWGHWISISFQKYIENIRILNKMNRFLKKYIKYDMFKNLQFGGL